MTVILRWIISAAAVWLAVRYVPGITIEEGIAPLFAVSFILGGVNLLVRPILRFLACGLIFLTLGLFLLVINAGMLLLASSISQAFGIAFHVDGFWPAFFGSLLISVVTAVAATVLLPADEKQG
jgi:putative membrane protein